MAILRELPADTFHTCVTSPPYFGLRDYGVDGQIGLEPTPADYIGRLVAVFAEVRRVLRPDSTCWIVIGDSYAGSGRGPTGHNGVGDQEQRQGFVGNSYHRVSEKSLSRGHIAAGVIGNKWVPVPKGYKNKDLIGIPWTLAFALRDDGWYLRSDIIWHKPNCMPESVTDRPTRCHEYVFLLSRSRAYAYDSVALEEPVAPSTVSRLAQDIEAQAGSQRAHGGTKTMKTVGNAVSRNKRDVWTIPTKGSGYKHFATFPQALVEPCILAGCPEGGIVLDPFCGIGTTGVVAERLGRNFVGIELNEVYAAEAQRRVQEECEVA